MKSICVYLGARTGNDPQIEAEVVALGKELAHNKIRLVYGGSSLGMMGLLARTVMSHGGQVTGIMSKCLLEKEQFIGGLDEFFVVDTMSERRTMMMSKADAFIVMPGGIGTLEETFEILNSISIGILDKPIGFLNVNNYYSGLFGFLNQCHETGFISATQLSIPLIAQDVASLLAKVVAKVTVLPEHTPVARWLK